MSTSRPRLSLVIPAFNEAGNVEAVVRDVLDTMRANPWIAGCEIVLVDDGSTDGTGAIMEQLAAQHPGVVVVHHPRNRGFGAALRSGFARTAGEIVGLMSADGELPADQVVNLLREMGNHDLILSRRERSVGVDRRVLTLGFDLMVRVILGFWVDKDVGIYLVRGDVVRNARFVSETGLVNLELILHCREQGLAVGKGGVTRFRPRLSGHSKVANTRTVLRTLWEMALLRWRRARG